MIGYSISIISGINVRFIVPLTILDRPINYNVCVAI